MNWLKDYKTLMSKYKLLKGKLVTRLILFLLKFLTKNNELAS